jgi:hypothetical protein
VFVVAGLLVVVALGVVWGRWLAGRRAKARPASVVVQAGTWPESPWLNARPGVKYVGDAVCARCHADISETFRTHPMGRSLAPVAAAPAVGFDQPSGTTTFSAGALLCTIERRGGREIYPVTYREGARVLAQAEAEVKYALGSGTRGISYLVEHDGRLFQSPISWYSQQQQWDLSPRYERANPHFDRPIDPGCLFCHSNRALPVSLSVNRYEEPPFRGYAVGCERCHGPGELHARGQQLSGGRDLTIVNPRHLDPVLRANVCEQCHLVGDQRADRAGREPFDYRPGLPLTEFFTVYGRANQQGLKLVGQVEQMKSSRCFRASQGRLGCTSCHDPHQVPDPEERIAYFRDQCLACHEHSGCKLPEPVRLARDRADACAGCHMPALTSTDIAHTAVTDHRILREPGHQPAAPRRAAPPLPLVPLNAERGSEPQDSVDRELAIAMALQGPRLPDTPQMKTIGPRVLAALDTAVAQRPDDLLARRMKAQALAFTGRRAEALSLADALCKSAPAFEEALDDFVTYAIDLGRFQVALEPARQAVVRNPWSAAYHERLAYLFVRCNDWNRALDEARASLRTNPFRRFARMFLIQCLLHDKDTTQADREFAALVKLHQDQREPLQQWFAQERRR